MQVLARKATARQRRPPLRVTQPTMKGAATPHPLLMRHSMPSSGVQSRFDHPVAGSNFSNIPVRPSLPGRLQAKLAVNTPGDSYEKEADRVAEQVMRMTEPQLQRKCACEGSCPDCQKEKDEDVPRLQMKSVNGSSAGHTEAPPSVHEVLRSPGQPLDTATRAFMEPRFGRDFSSVRVHTDRAASQSAEEVHAHAYTVGRDIVFAGGQSSSNFPLLAHELAHVTQQTDTVPALQRFPTCRHLLDPPEGASVSENSVRNSLVIDARRLGTVERELSVPGGSARPLRTEPGPGRSDKVIEPQVVDLGISGYADLAVLSGGVLEILEVKKATWPDALFAEAQVANYVTKGMEARDEVERIWRARGHPHDTILLIHEMPAGRINLLPKTRIIDGQSVELAWCRSGLIVFKAIGDKEKDTLICGVNDRGRTDAFLNRVLGPAQTVAEQFVSQQIESPVIDAVERRSLHDFMDLLKSTGLISTPTSAAIVEEFLKAHEPEVRAVLLQLAHAGLGSLRQQIQRDLRQMLAESATVVCSAIATLTAAALLREFLSRLPRFEWEPGYRHVAPNPIFLPEPVVVDSPSLSFRERVGVATGLSGIALTIYLIVSEGTRVK